MPRPRKVANLLALAVLATVIERPMHRYEMASLMRERGKDQDMQVKLGSLYTVVQNMERHGLLEQVGTDRHGARPERTIYRITAAGRAELSDWARELIAEVEPEHPHVAAGLSVVAVLPPAEVTELLRLRVGRLDQVASGLSVVLSGARREIPRLFLVEQEYALAMLCAERTWVAGLLQEMESGSFPDLNRWAHWHRSGEMPPDIAELARRGSLQQP